MMLGTIEILSSACQALPDKLPMLTSIAGLSKRIIELFDALELYANQPMPEHLRLQVLAACLNCRLTCRLIGTGGHLEHHPLATTRICHSPPLASPPERTS